MGKQALGLILCFVVGCVTSEPDVHLGIQPGYLGFVPARIAVMPCTGWPNETLDTEAASQLCQDLNKFVLDGFTGQPFMKGFSPKVGEKALNDAKLPMPSEMISQALPPPKLKTKPWEIYKKSVEPTPAWQDWLGKASQAIRSSDSILLPFVTAIVERDINERGLYIKERSAEVALLLVDTTKGNLQWVGMRQAAVQRKILGHEGAGNLVYAPWDEVAQRLLQEDLWREFPGRQVF